MNTKYQAGARISEYVLEAFLGAGTFGEVWRARHHVWNTEEVAIKLPTEPEYMRYLQREGVVVHGLRHPNIVRVMGLDPYAEIPYLVMELVRGPSLRDALAEHPRGLPVPVAITILGGILRGLGAAHEAGIVHRDLKPGNVLLNLGDATLDDITIDQVKITDFGLGLGNADTLRSMIMQSASIEHDQQHAAIAGTLAYMAPELREGTGQPTPRADLYSLGVVLYELLTGERPAGIELPSTVRAEVPTELDNIFRGLYAHFDRRYPDAAAVVEALAAVTQRPVPPPPPPASRKAALVAAVHGYAACPRCEAPVWGEDQFCTQCGFQLVERVVRCSSCGGYPGPGDHFCIFCGTAVERLEV